MLPVRIKLLDHATGGLPDYMTDDAVGMDLRAACWEDVTLDPGKYQTIPTGVCFELPQGIEAQVRPRSGLAAKNGVTILNSPGTIDPDYRGEVFVLLINHGDRPYRVQRGDRIAQVVFNRVEIMKPVLVSELNDTPRGGGGFGSTGR